MTNQHDYRHYLLDITQSIAKIQKYTGNFDCEQFVNNELIYDSTVFNLQIIGEATLNLPKEIQQKYPEVEWKDLAGLRNLIAHGYYKLKPQIIWNIIQTDLPVLQSQIDKIIELENPNPPLITAPPKSTSKSIYPKQRERAEQIIPIAQRLLKALEDNQLKIPFTIHKIAEIHLDNYQIKLTQSEQTLIIKNQADQILIKSTLIEGKQQLEFANGLEDKELNKWKNIEQSLERQLPKPQ